MKIKDLIYVVLMFILFMIGVFFDKMGFGSVLLGYLIGIIVVITNPPGHLLAGKIAKIMNKKIFKKSQ